MEHINVNDIHSYLQDHPASIITFFPLHKQKEDEAYHIGKVGIGKFIAIPAIGAKTLELLQEKNSIATTKHILKEQAGFDIDVISFVQTLADVGFIQSIDEHPLLLKERKPTFPWLQQQHITWLFSKPIYLLFILLMLFAGKTLFTHPYLWPKPQDFFWSQTISLVLIGNIIIRNLTRSIHELAHLIAARSRGILGYITLGTRLQFLVMQTNVTGLWAIPPKQRYRVYFAGIACNFIIASCALLIAAYIPITSFFYHMLRVIILINLFAFIPQFFVFMRTDMYFVLTTFLRCYNLYDDALTYFRYLLKRFLHQNPYNQKNPLFSLPQKEQQNVRWYMWFAIVGSIICLGTFFLYVIPIIVNTYMYALIHIHNGVTYHAIESLIDGVITLLLSFGTFILFLTVFSKNHKKAIRKVYRHALSFRF